MPKKLKVALKKKRRNYFWNTLLAIDFMVIGLAMAACVACVLRGCDTTHSDKEESNIKKEHVVKEPRFQVRHSSKQIQEIVPINQYN